jgi:hypothetical protein
MIGQTKCLQGEYAEANIFYEKSLKICLKILPVNHPDLAASYNDVGEVFDNMANTQKRFHIMNVL